MEELEVVETIYKLEEKIKTIEEKLDLIIQNINKVSNDTQRMDSHITFIEGIYEKIKSPFHFLMRKTEGIQDNFITKEDIVFEKPCIL